MRAPLIVAGLPLVAAAALVQGGCQAKPAPPTKPKRSEPVVQEQAEQVEPPPPEGVYVEIATTKPGKCVRTLCIGGPGELGAHPNFDLNETCRRSPGVVSRCEGELCMGVWPRSEWKRGLGALISSLDSDGDGKVSDADAPCSLRLGGWSTGAGLILTEIPARLSAILDEDHARIDNLFAVAPYVERSESEAPRELEVPATVRRAFIYRTTDPPESDCSRGYPEGPWISPRPICGPDTTCYDYDYAQRGDELAYLGRRGNRSGQAIGHCFMSSIVAKIGLENLARGREAPTKHVPPYANGERGGRVSERRKRGPGPDATDNPN